MEIYSHIRNIWEHIGYLGFCWVDDFLGSSMGKCTTWGIYREYVLLFGGFLQTNTRSWWYRRFLNCHGGSQFSRSSPWLFQCFCGPDLDDDWGYFRKTPCEHSTWYKTSHFGCLALDETHETPWGTYHPHGDLKEKMNHLTMWWWISPWSECQGVGIAVAKATAWGLVFQWWCLPEIKRDRPVTVGSC